MPYTADISRANPACIMFLVDQSGSMTGDLAGQAGQRKMDMAADAINRAIDNLSQRCSDGMEVRDYFHIGVIGYNTDRGANPILTSLSGATPEQPFMLISKVADSARVEERQIKESDGAGGLVEVTRQFLKWVEPKGELGTPMLHALQVTSRAIETWVAEYPDSFPPIVINVSDGAASDGDPEGQAQMLKGIQTSDGDVLMFNVHLSKVASSTVIQYPDSEERLPQEDDPDPDEASSRKMFRMSSVLPEANRNHAATLDLPVTENSRGYVYNADVVALVQFLDIGTRASTNLQ